MSRSRMQARAAAQLSGFFMPPRLTSSGVMWICTERVASITSKPSIFILEFLLLRVVGGAVSDFSAPYLIEHFVIVPRVERQRTEARPAGVVLVDPKAQVKIP